MQTPFNNLKEPHFSPSGSRPGVSGESVNAPFGPKAVDECGIDSVGGEYNLQKENHAPHDFAVGGVGRLSQNPMGGLHEDHTSSSVKP